MVYQVFLCQPQTKNQEHHKNERKKTKLCVFFLIDYAQSLIAFQLEHDLLFIPKWLTCALCRTNTTTIARLLSLSLSYLRDARQPIYLLCRLRFVVNLQSRMSITRMLYFFRCCCCCFPIQAKQDLFRHSYGNRLFYLHFIFMLCLSFILTAARQKFFGK